MSMDRKKTCEEQKIKVLRKVEEAKSKGMSRILVSPILEENVDEIRKEGISIQKISLKLKTRRRINIYDILSWAVSQQTDDLESWNSPKCIQKNVSVEEAEFFVKLQENGLL